MLQGCTDGVAPMSLDVYLDASLERGAAALSEVTVTADTRRAKQVEVQRLSVSAPVLREEIENLPLNARGITNLAAVAPGNARSLRSFLSFAPSTSMNLLSIMIIVI